MALYGNPRRHYWLLELTGDHRQVWGPYPTYWAARAEAGKRHTVIQGGGLENGQTFTPGDIRSAINSFRIYPVDGTDSTGM